MQHRFCPRLANTGQTQGTSHGAADCSGNYVAWTDEELLLETWAKSTEVDVPKLGEDGDLTWHSTTTMSG
ncbi:hypothetical protein QF047_004148 [Arthrobacter sp. W4I7]|nr:hypothetical protein [Arthrobacter sp. W4I7]